MPHFERATAQVTFLPIFGPYLDCEDVGGEGLEQNLQMRQGIPGLDGVELVDGSKNETLANPTPSPGGTQGRSPHTAGLSAGFTATMLTKSTQS